MNVSIETLNFHHLRYFWCVVLEGGVVPASRRLGVSHPTVSAQIRELESQLEVSLFQRTGRSLELTERGRRVFAHAERIFGLGRTLLEEIQLGTERGSLRIGVTDDLPKLLVRQLLAPALAASPSPRLTLHEERHQTLLGRLAVRELDLVLADAPTPATYRIQTEDRLLARSGVSFLATPALRARLQGAFPNCLRGAPFLAPPRESRLGQLLEAWMAEAELRPEVVAEVADSALLKTLGADGLGVFVVPEVAERAARETYGVERVGRLPNFAIEYYATTPLRAAENPWIERIVSAASERSNDLET